MELNIKFNKEMIVEIANRVLDGYEYNGKTIREWAALIANPKTNSDRVRSMSDEEFATAICKHDGCPFREAEDNECRKYHYDYNECRKYHYDCKACWLGWLKQDIPNDE